jgi:ABC-type bacteriocin/lantibiotic exporter with double-glycine peptidase domain
MQIVLPTQDKAANVCLVVVPVTLAMLFAAVQCWGSHPGKVVDSKMMCGPNCVWLAARSFNITPSPKKLRYLAGTDPHRGTSLEGMLTALDKIGLYPLLVKTSYKGLTRIKNPVILLLKHSSNGHYVFMEHISPTLIRVIDPPDSKTCSRAEFIDDFTGYAIVVCKNPEDKRKVQQCFTAEQPSRIGKRISICLGIAFALFVILHVLTGRMLKSKMTSTIL